MQPRNQRPSSSSSVGSQKNVALCFDLRSRCLNQSSIEVVKAFRLSKPVQQFSPLATPIAGVHLNPRTPGVMVVLQRRFFFAKKTGFTILQLNTVLTLSSLSRPLIPLKICLTCTAKNYNKSILLQLKLLLPDLWV